MSEPERVALQSPYDQVTLDVSDREAAAFAVMVLNDGIYGTKESASGFRIPPFMLAKPASVEAWWQEHFGASFETFPKRVSRKRLAAVYRSFRKEGEGPATGSDVVHAAHQIADRIDPQRAGDPASEPSDEEGSVA